MVLISDALHHDGLPTRAAPSSIPAALQLEPVDVNGTDQSLEGTAQLQQTSNRTFYPRHIMYGFQQPTWPPDLMSGITSQRERRGNGQERMKWAQRYGKWALHSPTYELLSG